MKRTQHQLPIFCQSFQFFVVKPKFLIENQVVNNFLLLGVTKYWTAVKIYVKQQILLCPSC